MKNNALITLIIFLFASAVVARAQVASSQPYVLEQSVIASGGGQNSSGGAYSLDGTIGQAAAGTRSTNSPFAVTGGFWTAAPLSATAAEVSVAGRVLTPEGRGLRNALVTLTDTQGKTRTVVTGAFGYYRFADVAAGETIVIAVRSKRYRFEPQILTVTEEVENLNFTAAGASKNSVSEF